MSLTPEQNIKAFIRLIKHQPSVLLDKNRVDLEQQIDESSGDIASLSDTISTWCKKYPGIRKALSQTRKSLFGSTPGKQKGQAETNPKPTVEEYKTLIKDQIRESFPETTNEQKPSDTNK
ncbi:MAG: hypothetical protein F6K41_05445 [Symploca sp. SIO3E6]|nr:hypothetical protein [Caldora sp. SIO3E6]